MAFPPWVTPVIGRHHGNANVTLLGGCFDGGQSIEYSAYCDNAQYKCYLSYDTLTTLKG